LIEDDDIKAVVDVLKADYLAQGPQVEKMEATICQLTGARYCVVVSNATAGLHIAVAALDLPAGSEGITAPITFLASANCMVYNNVKPCFADIDPRTYCMDPEKTRSRITPDTKLLIPVHFAGQAADMAVFKKLAEDHRLHVIEDAAHAIGSTYTDGTMVGNCKYSDMTVFSFHPVKTITTGEGGAITTNSKSLYERLLLLRSHGMERDPAKIPDYPGPWYYEMDDLGFNYRMTDIQAALGNSQLTKLQRFKDRRRAIIRRYNEAFKDLPLVTIPYETAGLDSCFHLYILQIDFGRLGKTRREVMADLTGNGVGTQVHYIPVPYQPYYKTRFFTKRGDYPIADAYYDRALSMPLYPRMTDEDVEKVILNVRRVCTR
jgi:UDP-4-amino-4,6-dideoxy-N-acetyl-beta-L-altrosamine transaminase